MEEIQPIIINLSKHKLTDGEKSLLLKGLKFTPKPKPDTLELKTDVQKFCRRLRLTEAYYDLNISFLTNNIEHYM